MWSSALIIVLYILRKRLLVLEVCSATGIISIYLFCALRLFLPIEFPWTQVINGGIVWNRILEVLSTSLGTMPIDIGVILLAIWIVVALIKMSRIFVNYYKSSDCVRKLPKKRIKLDMPALSNFDVYKTKSITTPCAAGIMNRIILFPDREYSQKQEAYILMHEITHHKNHDIITKLFINILCACYWWNPFVYLLKKDINQSLEIRCDQQVTQHLDDEGKVEYLSVILEEFKNSLNISKPSREYIMKVTGEEKHALVERFTLVANGKYVVPIWRKVMVVGILVVFFVGSYSVVIQSVFDVPQGDMEDGTYIYDSSDSYIIKHRDGSYSLITPSEEVEVDEEDVGFYVDADFIIREE